MPEGPKVVGCDEGEAIWFLGTLVVIKVSGGQTGGRFAIFDSLLPHAASPPVHTHPQDETFWVLEGELTVWLDGEHSRLPEGSAMFAPGGTPHSFRVESETARVLVLSTPAGIEAFARAAGEPAPSLTLPPPGHADATRARAQAAEKEYGVEMLAPPPN